jgi:hypothetical protein
VPKLLRDDDFRAKRTVLARKDFGYAPKPAPRPSDVITEATWKSIVTLPDDVAVRTSNYHGTTIGQLNALWGAWIESFGSTKDSLAAVMLDAGDDFQSATYAALTGFYRLSIVALRSALELVTIGAWAQTCGKDEEFRQWRQGAASLSYGRACDGLIAATDSLGKYLRATLGDSLFDQKGSTGEGGFARRIYSGVSDFSHSRPGHTDGDMRESNGPIYVRSVFEHVAWTHFEAMGLCFVLLLIARPKLAMPRAVTDLFGDATRLRSRVTRAAFEALNRGTA